MEKNEEIRMKRTMKSTSAKRLAFTLVMALLLNHACKRDDYYIDGGLANPIFDGTMMDYLDSKSYEFDSIAQIVRLAGLEKTFREEEFTFFAPRDENIKKLIGDRRKGGSANERLFYLGRDTIKTLADVDSTIWRRYLLRYMFHGKNKLADYSQIDFSILDVYPGQNYISYENSVSNIGVVYNDAGGVKYVGYRQLFINFIPNVSFPDSWQSVPVASSDVQPSNGVVHVLDFTKTEFGFLQYQVIDDITESKR